jgi:hypothetical protein
MTEKTMELLEAALVLLPYLKTSTDQYNDIKKADTLPPDEAIALLRKGTRPPETPAQRLRREADEMEAKDAAIERLRAAVAAFEGK